MSRIRAILAQAAGAGAIIFLLYCHHIDFLPADVSVSDIIPLALISLQFAAAFLLYGLLFALSGAFVAYLLNVTTTCWALSKFVISVTALAVRRLLGNSPSLQSEPRLRDRVRTPSLIRTTPLGVFPGAIAICKILIDHYADTGGGLSLVACQDRGG
jgi:hypothetical protein